MDAKKKVKGWPIARRAADLEKERKDARNSLILARYRETSQTKKPSDKS